MSGLPNSGDTLGRFRVERRLGKGGMGVVYLAQDSLLNIPVALKLLNPTPGLREAPAIERFKREVLLARRVAHPGICRLFDIHEQDDWLFLSMEYIPGPTLAEVLRDRTRLSAPRAVSLVAECCQALAAAHGLGVIHRDLKPSNIIVRGESNVALLDFGLARALDQASITVTNVQVGTMAYMSPEVLGGKLASPASDLYSLGVILYECLTGQLPFEVRNAAELGAAISRGEFIPIRQRLRTLNPTLERVVSRALSLDPGARFPDALALRTELLAADQESVERSAESTSPLMDRPRWDGELDRGIQTAFTESSAMLAAKARDATILFSDIVGITSFFDRYGDVAGMKRIRNHNALLFPVVARHRGEVVKTIGDAIMACFDSAEAGVGAAIGMQRSLDQYNACQSLVTSRIQIRVGLNSGPSIFEDRDVFGDVVNVAARVCAQAEGREILVTAATREHLNPALHPTAFYRQASLKGKSDTVDLFRVQWREGAEEDTRTATGLRRSAPWWRWRWPWAQAAAAGLLVVTAGLFAALWLSGTEPPPAAEPVAAVEPPAVAETVPLIPDAGAVTEPPDPAPPDAVRPETQPEPRPAVHPPAAARGRSDFLQLQKKLRQALRRELIDPRAVPPALKRPHEEMNRLAADRRFREATDAAQRCLNLVESLTRDESFVRRKNERFNAQYSRLEAGQEDSQLRALSSDISRAMMNRDFSGANEKLNRALRLLRAKVKADPR